jgi:uncharacterized membrane protein
MISWDKVHGAMTHFPIALLLFSTACDLVSVTFKKLTFARGLRIVSFYGLAGAALGVFGCRGLRHRPHQLRKCGNFFLTDLLGLISSIQGTNFYPS